MSKVQIIIETANPIVRDKKIKIAEQIIKLDLAVLQKLAELCKSEKAIAYINDKENWEFLKSMIM